jgi:hypothetical protein
MKPESPLRAALLTVSEAAESIRAARREDEAMLDRLGKEAARIMNQHALVYLRSARQRTLLLAALALFGAALVAGAGGYVLGSRATDEATLVALCRGGEVRAAADGHRYCARWLDPAPLAK